jgi:hypothetical protein
MAHIAATDVIDRVWAVTPSADRIDPSRHSVLVVSDEGQSNESLDLVCEFLDIDVVRADGGDDLGPMLLRNRPMAVIANLDGEGQDGCHVMKTIAGYNRSLPILLFSSNEPALLGAVDAVREIWGLAHVSTVHGSGGIGALVDFICHASRDAGRSRLMRI